MTGRWIRWLPVLLATIVGTAACSSIGERAGHTSTGSSDLIVVDSGGRVTALRARDGSIAFQAPAELAMPGRSELISARIDGAETVVSRLDPVTGEPSSTARRLQGELAVRVASVDGSLVALMAPPAEGLDPWTPVPRTSTDIVVADAAGIGETERYRLRGNYEPEAFSSDGGHLFLISYVPPADPSAYRVESLDLATGKVEDVFGRDKAPSETMGGTRLNQVLAPDGDRLYTLYTDQPAEYAEGYGGDAYASGGWGEESPGSVAFVHTLSLRDEWAFCAGLPRAFGSGPADAKAIAVSPDGRRVFVVDTGHGLVAELAARSMNVARVARVDLGALASGTTFARTSGDGGTLFVGRGDAIVSIDTDAMRASRPWSLGATLVGMTLSPDGRRLYAAVPGRIEQLEPSTGAVQGSISAPELAGVAAIEAIGS